MQFFTRLSVFFVFFLLSSVTSADEPMKKNVGDLLYMETIVTAKVPFKANFFSAEKEVEISGILWTPVTQDNPVEKFPLLIFNHGSQDFGSSIAFTANEFAFLLQKRIAIFQPIRKGFSRKGSEPSEVNVNTSEPVGCNNGLLSSGLSSATADVTFLVKNLQKREDIDLSKIVLGGRSRGGFLSLFLASQKTLPGIIGIVNFDGGWHGETCSDKGSMSFNGIKFREFGEKIHVPIVSFYGDKDNYFDVSYIKGFLSSLRKNEQSTSFIFEGAPHGNAFIMKSKVWEKEVLKMFE